MEHINAKGQTEAEFLTTYSMDGYDKPSVTVDNVVFTLKDGALSVLLIKRKNHPYIHSWALPGGFLEMHEAPAEAAQRELFEETGVHAIDSVQLRTFGDPGRDPRGRIISIAYLCIASEGHISIQAGDDASDALLFKINIGKKETTCVTLQADDESYSFTINAENGLERMLTVGENRLAFDHAKIITYALFKLLDISDSKLCDAFLPVNRNAFMEMLSHMRMCMEVNE